MKAVKVQYTVKPEFVAQNEANVKAVMDYLQANPVEGMYYSTCKLPDGVTFMHFNIAKDQETLSKLNDVEAFTLFRKALKESGPVSPPKSEDLSFVGSSWEI